MLRKTHMAMGVAAALAMTQPETIPDCIPVIASSAVGSVISDIDAEQSTARKEADIALTVCTVLTAGILLLRQFTKIDILNMLENHSTNAWQIPAGILFIVLCTIGKNTQHRSLMHSIAAGILLSACVYITLSPTVGIAFACGFVSHLVLDLLNYKGLQLLWPLKCKFCIGVCTSNGFVNNALGIIGLMLVILLLLKCVGIQIFAKFI